MYIVSWVWFNYIEIYQTGKLKFGNKIWPEVKPPDIYTNIYATQNYSNFRKNVFTTNLVKVSEKYTYKEETDIKVKQILWNHFLFEKANVRR